MTSSPEQPTSNIRFVVVFKTAALNPSPFNEVGDLKKKIQKSRRTSYTYHANYICRCKVYIRPFTSILPVVYSIFFFLSSPSLISDFLVFCLPLPSISTSTFQNCHYEVWHRGGRKLSAFSDDGIVKYKSNRCNNLHFSQHFCIVLLLVTRLVGKCIRICARVKVDFEGRTGTL